MVHRPLTGIVLTHGHADHVGSAAALAERTGARVFGPAAEQDVIEGRAALPMPRLRDWEVPLFEQIMPQVPPAPSVRLDETLAAGDRLPLEGRAELVAAPGHTDGQLVVWFPDDRVLLAADGAASFEGRPMAPVFNVEPERATATYRHLADLDPAIACFGHGEPLIGDAGATMRASRD